MPDHWHPLIRTGFPLTISQAIHNVKKVSAGQFHRQRGTQGPVWQHQFWDRFVRHAREFNDRLEYMHLNPLRKGLVSNPEESSYNNFSLDPTTVRGCPIQIDYVSLSETEKPTVRKTTDRGYPLPARERSPRKGIFRRPPE